MGRATVISLSLSTVLAGLPAGATPAGGVRAPCTSDAMIVFDASGSMAGTDMNTVSPHIAKVRRALARVLPSVAPLRNLGLLIYGPGSYNQCNSLDLRLRPGPHSSEVIMAEVNAVVPAGKTPLTESVRRAAEVLDYRNRRGEVVLLTDGEETCGGDPCRLARDLKAEAANLVVHVIGFRSKATPAADVPFTSRCLAEETGGHFITAGSEDELVAAFQKTLGCPFLTRTRERSFTRLARENIGRSRSR